MMGAPHAMQQLAYIHGEVSRVYGGQRRPELLRNEGQEQKRTKLGKKNGMMRRWPMGGVRVPLVALQWILLKAQMMSVGALREGNPSTARDGTRARDKESDKMGQEVLPSGKDGEKFQVGERKGKNRQGLDPRTFEEKHWGPKHP